MSNTSIKAGSENYCAQIIKLPAKVPVPGLDRLVEVTYQGNNCLVGKDSDSHDIYVFFPAGSVLSPEFLRVNNLYRHTNLNADTSKSGMFDDSGRVKAIKLRGVISTGLIVNLNALAYFTDIQKLKVGESFNTIGNQDICTKYVVERKGANLNKGAKKEKTLDDLVDSKLFPEHIATSHMLRNIHKFNLEDNIVVSFKLHGTSLRLGKQPVAKELSFKNRIAKKLGVKIQETEHKTVVGSRRVLKSVDFKGLSGKNHYYASDVWSAVAKEKIGDNLNKGEAVYAEIIGVDYQGGVIQKGYSYGLTEPELYIYRITNINPDGIEVDLSWNQMEQRAQQLGVKVVPVLFKGTLLEFIKKYGDVEKPMEQALEELFYEKLLEKPSVLDASVVEEGFCIRKDTYPVSETFKIKSRKFLLHESGELDAGEENVEDDN